MKAFKLAVWDEAGMAHCFNHSSVEYTLVDICESPTLYAGKVIVLSGDFRQLLPVVELGSSLDSVRAYLKNYPRIWDKVRIMRLMRNMRLERLTSADADLQRAFSNWLLTIGNENLEPSLSYGRFGNLPEVREASTHSIEGPSRRPRPFPKLREAQEASGRIHRTILGTF